MEEVRSRVIGTEGKTRKTVESITGCYIIIKDNVVGILGPTEEVEAASTAIANIAKGSKQGNAYRYLERMNQARKLHDEGLGLKAVKEKDSQTKAE